MKKTTRTYSKKYSVGASAKTNRGGMGGGNGTEEEKVLGMLDLPNAFNELERSASRRAVREMVPGFTFWVDSCYGEPSV